MCECVLLLNMHIYTGKLSLKGVRHQSLCYINTSLHAVLMLPFVCICAYVQSGIQCETENLSVCK